MNQFLRYKTLVLFFILTTFGKVFSQSVFKVQNHLQQIYPCVPNPISFASFGVNAKSFRVKAIDGVLDTVNDVLYWTPKFTRTVPVLVFQEKRNNLWTSLDTVISKIWIIDSDNEWYQN
jgi:hypothetical protein